MRLRYVSILAVLLASPLTAAPPTFDPPAQIPTVSGVAVWMPPADCVSVKYIGLDGEEEFPLELIGGSRTGFAFITRGLPAGKVYRFTGVASSATGEQIEKTFAVTIPGDVIPPPKKPPDPVDPPPPTKGLFFVVVRPDGPADPTFTKAMGFPAWSAHRLAGNNCKDYTATEAKERLKINTAGVTLPAVYVLQGNADGKTSKIVRGPVDLPGTDAGVAKLAEGIQ